MTIGVTHRGRCNRPECEAQGWRLSLPEIPKPIAPRAERSEGHGGWTKKNTAPKGSDNHNGRDAEFAIRRRLLAVDDASNLCVPSKISPSRRAAILNNGRDAEI
jgi:hypothetical protein